MQFYILKKKKKKKKKKRNFDPLICWKEIQQFFGSLFGNHNSVFAQTFHGPSVSQNSTLVKVYVSSNLSLRQNKPIKFVNLTLLASWKEIHQFFGTDSETTFQFLPKLLIALQYHNMNVGWKFLVQTIYLLVKTNQWNLEFLIKPQVSFCSNLASLFNVIKHNSSVLF